MRCTVLVFGYRLVLLKFRATSIRLHIRCR